MSIKSVACPLLVGTCLEDNWEHRHGTTLAKNNTGNVVLFLLSKKSKQKKASVTLKGSKTARRSLRKEMSMKVSRHGQTVMLIPCSSVRS